MYRVNKMAQGEEVCTIQTSFKDLRLYFCSVTGRQASGEHVPPERLVLRTEKVTYTTSFLRTADKILVPTAIALNQLQQRTMVRGMYVLRINPM